MENIQMWCMEVWQLLIRMFNHQLFTQWVYYLIGSLVVLFIFCKFGIKAQSSNPTEPNDRIVYRWGMLGLGIQALIFISLPIIYRTDILLFSWILFTPFTLISLIDIYWLIILKAKYDNNPESIATRKR